MLNNKAISPVVATALLLVVAVVAVVGFQGWFTTYSSGMFSDIEIQSGSALDGSLKIENLIGDMLYVINNIQDNLSITTLKIGGNVCTVTNNLTLGMNEIPVSSCVGNLTTPTPDIVLITEKDIVAKKIYVDRATSNTLDCSTLNGGEWILVPGNGALGTNDFCVMKYEAKQNGSNVTSTAANPPWVLINQTDAREACSNLGTGYHLITSSEWMTIARNIEQVDNNWVNSVGAITSVGVGSLKQGNVGATGIVGASYDGAGPEASSDGVNSLGSLELDNGEIIWDLSGNVWEWNSDTLNTTGIQNSSLGTASSNWYEWDNISGYSYLKPNDITLNSTNGIGRVYTDTGTALPSGDVHAFLRSGGWDFGAFAGAFALYLYNGPSFSHSSIGFRCSYAP